MATRVDVERRASPSASTTLVHHGMLGGQFAPSGKARARTNTVRPTQDRGRRIMPVRACATVYTVLGAAKIRVSTTNKRATVSATAAIPTSGSRPN